MLNITIIINGTIFINGVLKYFEAVSSDHNGYIVLDIDNGSSHHSIPKHIISNEDTRLFRLSGNKYQLDSINKVLI